MLDIFGGQFCILSRATNARFVANPTGRRCKKEHTAASWKTSGARFGLFLLYGVEGYLRYMCCVCVGKTTQTDDVYKMWDIPYCVAAYNCRFIIPEKQLANLVQIRQIVYGKCTRWNTFRFSRTENSALAHQKIRPPFAKKGARHPAFVYKLLCARSRKTNSEIAP